jgi:acyl carrier protein
LDIQDAIHEYLLTEFGADRDAFAPDENLLAQGVIDSMGIVRLVAFLEERFAIETGDDDMVPENFESLAALRAFVERKRGA